MDNKETNTVPNMETMTVHGSKVWIYATVGGRSFKVNQDDEGHCIVKEMVAQDQWVDRNDPGFDTMAEAIVNHADAGDYLD